jgi:hypothetical protein
MAKKALKTLAANDLQKKEDELKEAGVDCEVFEYSHGYFDLLFKDEEGTKVKLEYRPDGSEILRDDFGREVE